MTTASEMVEKVARAICASRGGDPDECISGYSWAVGEMGRAEGGSVCHSRNWERYVVQARAALSAIDSENERLREDGLLETVARRVIRELRDHAENISPRLNAYPADMMRREAKRLESALSSPPADGEK